MAEPSDDRAAPSEERAAYDGAAEGYARHWGPVIRPAAELVLDDLVAYLPELGSRPLRAVDIGTGTGTLAIAAVRRFPELRVAGIDASRDMARYAEGEADRALDPADRPRFATDVAFADRLPQPDASQDGAMSSFVFQLVASRPRALREARRVLKPGAPLAYVTWLRRTTGEVDPPDRIFDQVLDEFDFDPPGPDGPDRDPASVTNAAASLRSAGFRDVRAHEGAVDHAWTPRTYVDFLEGFAETSIFEELVERERRRLRKRLLERLAELRPDELRFRSPIVYVVGRRNG